MSNKVSKMIAFLEQNGREPVGDNGWYCPGDGSSKFHISGGSVSREVNTRYRNEKGFREADDLDIQKLERLLREECKRCITEMQVDAQLKQLGID